MLDRITNVLVLLIAALVVFAVSSGTLSAWRITPLEDYAWTARVGVIPSNDVDVYFRAKALAVAGRDWEAADEIEAMLRKDYQQSETPVRRLNLQEIASIGMDVLPLLLAFAIPVTINYIRHARFRLWNRRT